MIFKTRNDSIPLKKCKLFCFSFSSGIIMEHIFKYFMYMYIFMVMYMQSGVNTRRSFNCGFIYSSFS